MQGERSVGALKLPAAMAEVSASHAVNAPQISDTDRRNLWLVCISEKTQSLFDFAFAGLLLHLFWREFTPAAF